MDTLAQHKHRTVVALAITTHNHVALAKFDHQTATALVAQIHDDNAYSKTLAQLGAHDPAVLILPNDARSSVLQRIVRSDFPHASIESLQRKHWDAARGLVMLSHYALPAHAQDLKASLENQQLALAALAALLHFIEFHDKVALYRGALKLSVAVVQGIMPLEPAAVRNLELLRSARTGEASRSLFAVLNSCSTAAGARLLRSSITQPSTDARTINMRLDCVGTLLREEGLLVNLRKLLPAFSDCDRILQHFVRQSSTASSDRSGRTLESTDSVLHLKTVLQMAPQLAAALSRDGAQPPEDELLLQMHECLASPELETLERTIGQVIEEDAGHAKRTSQRLLQSLFAVRPAIDARLDVARVTLGDLVGAMELLLERAHSHQNASYLSLDYNMKRGYHFTLPAARRAEAEALGVFIQMQMQGKKKVSCTTDELARLNSRCKEAIDEILARSVSVLEQLVAHVQTRLHLLFQIAESVAQLDMYISFATYAQRSACECTIPTLVAPGEPLVLKRAYHPVLEPLGDFSAVANDAFISPSCNLQVITGPNMSGKSTYLKQVALICLMAHMGCPVPAQVASVPRMQRILTCLSAVDGIDSDSSTFQCEMREMSHILRTISASDDQHVLVLVDELGRGTSSRDGAAIAWAVAEELQRRPRTYALFATHFLQLANLHELYPNVKQLRLIVEPAESRLNFLFKVETGVTTQQQYMTDYLAAVAGIPSDVCEAARNLCQRFQFDPVVRETAHARIEAARLALAERLVWLGRNSTMSDRSMRAFLIEFKSQLSLDSLKRPLPPKRPIKRGRGSCDGTARSSAPSASTPTAGASAVVDKDTHAAHALLSLGGTDTPQPDATIARRHFATTPPQKLALPPLGPTTPEPTIDDEAQWRELDALADAAVWPRAAPTCDEHLTLDELLAQAA